MTSGPITSWEIDGETVETVSDFIFGVSKITADSDRSYEIKRCLLLGRKVMTSLDSILKSRDIVNKGPSSQGYGFSSSHFWMWELDCKKSWVQKNWCLWTEALEKTLESPLDCKQIIPRCSLEGLMLKLKLQYFGHLRRRADSLEKTLMLRGIGGRRRRGQQRMRWWMTSPTRWTWIWVNCRSWWWTGRPCMLWFMGLQRVGHDWVTELSWTESKEIWYKSASLASAYVC